jgi:hypothetical protein
LKPLIAISSRETWIYEKPELIKQIRKGLQEAKEGKTGTLENFEKILGDTKRETT